MAKVRPLTDVTFVVVDIETTGSVPIKDGITEIGAVKVRNGEIIDRFSQLINPEKDIPPFIQKLTGITPGMVADQPTIDQVMPAFWEFLGDGVFVAHNAQFDFRFLSSVTHKLLGEDLSNKSLCTCRLARKLLPDQKKKNLGAVSEYFKIEIEARHRAYGDAEATAQILLRFLDMLAEDNIETLAQLMAYQEKGGKRYAAIRIPFPEHKVREFPQRPGVYFMRSAQGDILYIGKAKNLKKRLQSYFSGLNRQPDKVQELMQQVYDIETHILGSELEALLEEARLIKHHQPVYNKQIKRYRDLPFLRISVQDRYPRLSVTTDIDDSGALYFGPYRRKSQLVRMVEALSKIFQIRTCSDVVFKKHVKLQSACMALEIGTCTGPCIRKVGVADYGGQVEAIIAFLEGRVAQLTDRLVAERERHTELLAYEKAQEVHERLLSLLRLQANTQFLAQAVHQNHLVIVLPDRDAPRHLILYIYKGRPIARQVFDPRTDQLSAIFTQVAQLQRMLSDAADVKRDIIPQRELEEIRIIASWLKARDPLEPDNAQMWHLFDPYEKLVDALTTYFSHTGLPDESWDVDPPFEDFIDVDYVEEMPA